MNLLLILVVLTSYLVVQPITRIFFTVAVSLRSFAMKFPILELSLVLLPARPRIRTVTHHGVSLPLPVVLIAAGPSTSTLAFSFSEHPITHIFVTGGVQHGAFAVHFVFLELSLVLVAVSRDKEVATGLSEYESGRRKFIYEKERV